MLSVYLKIFSVRCLLFYSSAHEFVPSLESNWYHVPSIFSLLETSHLCAHMLFLSIQSGVYFLSLNLAGLWLALTNSMQQKWHPASGRPRQLWIWLSWGPLATMWKKSNLPFGTNKAAEAPDMWVKYLDPPARVKLSQPTSHEAETSRPHPALPTLQNWNKEKALVALNH